MRRFSALFVLLAVMLASLLAHVEESAASRGHQALAAHGLQGHDIQFAAASPAVAKAGGKMGCRRSLPSAGPTSCGGAHALVIPVATGSADTGSTVGPRTIIGRLKPYRPKGLLDPPRSA
jgi:hypothetical protein